MNLYTQIPPTLKEVDIIVAGGGTTGCVVAARLADADPNLQILVIERGPNNEMPTIEHPICFLSHLMPDSKTVDFNASKPSPNVGGRPLIVPAGSVLGGGSSVNFMMYSRAQGRDFDAWDTPGWSAREMLPFLKKSETYHGEDKKDVHGHDGPVHVSRGTFASSSLEDDCIAAAEKVGIPEVQDLSDLESVNAIHRAKRFVSADGKRQDAATCYLHPRLRDGKHSNLHVLVETQVSRVLFDEEKKRATGIEFRPNPKFHRNATSEPSHSIKARKLVILSSGTCATPSILERSGVGEAKVLEHAGVPVILDLPGVGNGYEDHHLIAYPYLNNLAAEETLDAFVFGRMGNSEDIIKSQHKILGWNAQDVQAKVRPTEAEVDALGPEFREAWDKEYKEHPGKPMAIFAPISGFAANPQFATGDPSFSISTFTIYPFSRGSIHITGPSLDAPVNFDNGFFAGKDGALDVKKIIWTYKKQRAMARHMACYRGEVSSCHPPFASGSNAACIGLTEPLPNDKANIIYSLEDDIVLDKWIRENVGTTWHSLGTCKMLPRERLGVVDAELGVHGVEALKIADLSIVPGNVAGNTNNTALTIGEKAADLFIKELGL